MKRRILLVDDDLAVLLTLKAVVELNGFEVETAGGSAEALARMESGVYQMVISDLRMESAESGLEVLRAEHRDEQHRNGQERNGEVRSCENSDSLLVKPLGTAELLRQVEALLIRHADKRERQRKSAS